jgi:class 3 adenylate cyclase
MLDFDQLSLTDIIRLQNELSALLAKRYERWLALVFSDIVESTAYFARYGDEAGRRLQQRHIDLLRRGLGAAGGRIVDTAGDGVFLSFPSVGAAAEALIAFQQLRGSDNVLRSPAHVLVTRAGLHWGPVLTDGSIVTGDAVNLCARLTSMASPQRILLTRAAFLQLSQTDRLRCRALSPVALSGIAERVDVLDFEWRDPTRFPTSVLIQETGEEIALPDQPTIAFGRLGYMDGMAANDIVLALPDSSHTQQISRWHFDLRREATGLVLRSLSNRPTEVDGVLVPKGHEHPVTVGSKVRLSGVITLSFAFGGFGATDDTTSIALAPEDGQSRSPDHPSSP